MHTLGKPLAQLLQILVEPFRLPCRRLGVEAVDRPQSLDRAAFDYRVAKGRQRVHKACLTGLARQQLRHDEGPRQAKSQGTRARARTLRGLGFEPFDRVQVLTQRPVAQTAVYESSARIEPRRLRILCQSLYSHRIHTHLVLGQQVLQVLQVRPRATLALKDAARSLTAFGEGHLPAVDDLHEEEIPLGLDQLHRPHLGVEERCHAGIWGGQTAQPPQIPPTDDIVSWYIKVLQSASFGGLPQGLDSRTAITHHDAGHTDLQACARAVIPGLQLALGELQALTVAPLEQRLCQVPPMAGLDDCAYAR